MVNLDIIRPTRAEHFDIHRRADRFAAWPFNCGVWKYPGDEVVVGFASRTCHYAQRFEVYHGYAPKEGVKGKFFARSTDGGATWQERELVELRDLDWRLRLGEAPFASDEPLNLAAPDVLLAHYQDQVLVSADRGRTFVYAARVPAGGHESVMGRPDYVIRPDGACILFSTVSTTTGVEGRPVVYISRNDGDSWEFLNYMTPEPESHMMIMPSGLWLASGRMIAAVRVQMQKHGFSFWSEVYASDDGGRTWAFLSRVNDLGAPCHLLLLDDGRVLATYGYRSRPFGIRARVSANDGASWGPEIILRDDGKSWDLGYPKSVQLDGGDVVTAYYFSDQTDPVDVDGGVRYIGGTRWGVEHL